MPDPLRELLADGIVAIHVSVLLLYWCGGASALSGGFLRHPLAVWQRLYLVVVIVLLVRHVKRKRHDKSDERSGD
jgi:hypothetical protein